MREYASFVRAERVRGVHAICEFFEVKMQSVVDLYARPTPGFRRFVRLRRRVTHSLNDNMLNVLSWVIVLRVSSLSFMYVRQESVYDWLDYLPEGPTGAAGWLIA